jgi:hypothetical protein
MTGDYPGADRMKSYARRNKREQLNVKYRWRGMARTNIRKLNGRRKYERLSMATD